jgi:hypothetical protein
MRRKGLGGRGGTGPGQAELTALEQAPADQGKAVALAQLPAVEAGFTGRQDELDQIAALLDPGREGGTVVVSALAGLAGSPPHGTSPPSNGPADDRWPLDGSAAPCPAWGHPRDTTGHRGVSPPRFRFSVTVPPAWQLTGVFLATLLAVAGLTAVPSRLAARHPPVQVLQTE